MSEKILIVDDDPVIVELLETFLEEEGWEPISATDGKKALDMVNNHHPDLIILDIKMPGIDGIEVCRRIRNRYSIPIIMLTALHDAFEKVKCFNSGADDYVTKPFMQAELSARIKAILKRVPANQRNASKSENLNSISIDLLAKKVSIDGREIKTTPTEFRLLEELAHHSGKMLTYKYLLRKIWGNDFQDQKGYLHVHIKHLRDKLEPDPRNPIHILNVAGHGYRVEGITII